jgi:hypothetical protein
MGHCRLSAVRQLGVLTLQPLDALVSFIGLLWLRPALLRTRRLALTSFREPSQREQMRRVQSFAPQQCADGAGSVQASDARSIRSDRPRKISDALQLSLTSVLGLSPDEEITFFIGHASLAQFFTQ